LKRFNHVGLPTTLPELEAVAHPDGTRTYRTPSGLHYPSVTTVLSMLNEQHIKAWKDRIGYDKATAIAAMAADRGTHLHSAIETYLQNEDISKYDPKTKILLNRIKFTLNRINNISAQEVPLYSDELRLAGRCDCIAEFDRIPSIIDFKTANKLKKKDWILNYFLQTTAYSIMYQERTGIEIGQIVIIITGEDCSGAVHVENRADYTQTLRDTLHRYYNEYEAEKYANSRT